MKQATFASLNCDAKKRHTRREVVLADMVVPRDALLALSSMLLIQLMQQLYALSDPAMEDALYEIESMRRFVGFELNEDATPDEATILKFGRWLEQHGLPFRDAKAKF